MRRSVHPAVVRLEQRARAFLPGLLSQHPDHIAEALAARHADTLERAGQRAANIELRTYTESVSYALPPTAGEESLRAWARNRARDCRRCMQASAGDEWDNYAAGRVFAGGFGFEPPKPDKQITVAGCVARLGCERWWRRQARTIHGRRMEREARALGLVHKHAGLYVSDDCLHRWAGRQAANARTLAETVARCEETGEELRMSDVAAAGMANPEIRRGELMTRVRGMQEIAELRRDAGLFVTWTVPPALHAIHSRTLTAGEGARVTPREAQAWLRRQWARARAKLKREGVQVYGLRVAEPHHDGTPHWHLLLWVPPAQRQTLRDVLTAYALDGATDRARREHACKIVDIEHAPDRSRSAAGYVAKYVAKAIDGAALNGVRTSGDDGSEIWLDLDAADAAARVRAWASQWGIRQFQPIGCPPVTVWREMRRLDPIRYGPVAEAIRQAADAGDWCRYMQLMGGPCCPRDAQPARVRYMADVGVGDYGEPRTKPFVECAGRPYVTRPYTWRIEYRPAGESLTRGGAAPWTCGNNCTRGKTRQKNEPENRDTGARIRRQSGRAPPVS